MILSKHTSFFMIMSVILLVSVLPLACTSEKSATTPSQKAAGADNRTSPPGGYALEITPAEPDRNSTLILTPKGFNIADARIIWMVNSSIDPEATASQYQPVNAARGDSIQAKAVFQGAEILSNSVTIKNTPPAISQVKFIPEAFKAGDKLGVEPTGTDADGDTVTFLYEWTVNGEPAGNGQYLGSVLKRGMNIAVRITPFDGVDYGEPVMVKKEFVNMPPVITQHKECTFNGSLYTYQVKASDPDGDPLTYSMDSAPEGMTIDSSTGLITWVVPPDFKGAKNFGFTVKDGHGGSASCNVPVTIQ